MPNRDETIRVMWNAYAKGHFDQDNTRPTDLELAGMTAALDAYEELYTPLARRVATLRDSVDNALRGIVLLGYPQAALCVVLQRVQTILQDMLKEP